jgi:hypothetical protein
MKAKLIKDTQAAPSAGDDSRLIEIRGIKFWPAGTVLEDKRAYRLVQLGVAEPADPECALAAGMTSEQMRIAQRQQEMVSKGIQPDDYQRYLDGEITGYDADGNDIPGPNYIEETDDE